jgi:sugar lactone lactonase YvrE
MLSVRLFCLMVCVNAANVTSTTGPTVAPTRVPTALPTSYINIMSTVVGTGASNSSGDGGLATAASINNPRGIVFDVSGNYYVVDGYGCRVRKVTHSTGYITTVAGTGSCSYNGDGAKGTAASLQSPWGVAVDSSGNIYIADTGNHRVRLVTSSTGIITTVAGTGTSGYTGDRGAATSATLAEPRGVALDSSGNIYIADHTNGCIQKVTYATGIITTLVTVSYPELIAVDTSGNIYIASPQLHLVQKYTVSSGVLSVVAGTGTDSSTGELLRVRGSET